MSAVSLSSEAVPLLETVRLGYTVGGKRILDGVSLTVERGELVGVTGPNGAGKTTFLRLVCGLLPASAGSVRLSGKTAAALPHRARARMVSFMSQEIMQDLGFSVLDVILMGRYPHLGRFQRESPEDTKKARRMLSYVGLAGFERRPFGELSGGERQLVLFAKVLVQETELVVLDEPSSHLDLRHEDTVFSMAQELTLEGRAVVASVHNLNVASQYCTKLLLLDRGMPAAFGPPAAVFTSETLERVYGVRTLVSHNSSTGSLMVSVVPFRAHRGGVRVHLIGGAGSALNLTRELYRLGFSLSGGIAHASDSDETLWKSLGIECISVGSFSRITEKDIESAVSMVEEAELVVLCSFPVGVGNLGNLGLARKARRLVILSPGPGDAPRSFFAEEGRALFDELGGFAEEKPYEDLVTMLRNAAKSSAGL
jgi:iron complex transport system ATP-binding protein